MYDIKQIQRALNARGFGPLDVDGIFGPKTSDAVIRFKVSQGLMGRDYVGPITYAKLMNAPEEIRGKIPTGHAPWYSELLKMIGKTEFQEELKLWLASDGQTLGDPSVLPWCGDAIETSMLLAIPGLKMPDNPYAAVNWASWGEYVEPQQDCILSFWRVSPNDWRGHVGYYAGESQDNYYVLGGNQSNKVSIAPISKGRLRRNGSRWPIGSLHRPTGNKVVMSGGTVSTNEF